MDYNIWYSGRWKNYIKNETNNGIRMHYSAEITGEIRKECKKFVSFLRKEYEFPLRVEIYIKIDESIFNSIAIWEINKSNNAKIKIKLCKISLNVAGEIKKQIIRGLTYYFLYINHMNYEKEELILQDYEERILSDYELMKNERGTYKWHLWTLYDWEKYFYLKVSENYNNGLRMKIDKEINSSLRTVCKKFAVYLRNKYLFPIRISVYIKNVYKIKASDGDYVYGLLRYDDDFTIEPKVWIAAGDFDKMKKKNGCGNAICSILNTVAHELTHYFQFINHVNFTPIGLERQANEYAESIVDDFIDDLQKKKIDIENI